MSKTDAKKIKRAIKGIENASDYDSLIFNIGEIETVIEKYLNASK